MTLEFVAIIAVGVALAGMNLRSALLMNRRIDRLVGFERGMAELRERMARLEGLPEGLRESMGRATA